MNRTARNVKAFLGSGMGKEGGLRTTGQDVLFTAGGSSISRKAQNTRHFLAMLTKRAQDSSSTNEDEQYLLDRGYKRNDEGRWVRPEGEESDLARTPYEGEQRAQQAAITLDNPRSSEEYLENYLEGQGYTKDDRERWVDSKGLTRWEKDEQKLKALKEKNQQSPQPLTDAQKRVMEEEGLTEGNVRAMYSPEKAEEQVNHYDEMERMREEHESTQESIDQDIAEMDQIHENVMSDDIEAPLDDPIERTTIGENMEMTRDFKENDPQVGGEEEVAKARRKKMLMDMLRDSGNPGSEHARILKDNYGFSDAKIKAVAGGTYSGDNTGGMDSHQRGSAAVETVRRGTSPQSGQAASSSPAAANTSQQAQGGTWPNNWQQQTAPTGAPNMGFTANNSIWDQGATGGMNTGGGDAGTDMASMGYDFGTPDYGKSVGQGSLWDNKSFDNLFG